MEVQVAPVRAINIPHRDQILRLQDAIMNDLENRVGPESCPVQHYFAPGSYAREISMPAGLTVVGKIHKHAHVNIISAGRCVVFTEGEGTQFLCAPLTFISRPGTKRVVVVLEDTVWTTVHATDKTDVDLIEQEIIAKEYREVLA